MAKQYKKTGDVIEITEMKPSTSIHSEKDLLQRKEELEAELEIINDILSKV